MQALAAAREALYQRARAQAGDAGQADVSAETPLAEMALHHRMDPGAPGERYQVVVHVDAPVLADPDAPGQSALEDGTRVSAETSRRLACDASRVMMQHGRDGRVVEVAARTRTIPPALLFGGHELEARGDEEARRLLYIAMTRAREELCVSSYGDSQLMDELREIVG